MQPLLLPAASSGNPAVGPPLPRAAPSPLPLHRRLPRPSLSSNHSIADPAFPPPNFLSSRSLSSPKPYLSSFDSLRHRETKLASSIPPTFHSSDEPEKVKLAQVAKRLENTSRYFKRLGSLGFWGQLVCTVVASVILSFSIVITGKITSPASFYATTGGIAAAFISVFWSFGYMRLSEKLRKIANDPSKAPPRVHVVKSLRNGIVLNLLGMGAAILGMQATVGLLVAKALTTSANPYYQGISSGSSPVLALDVFLVQASANTIVTFLGAYFLTGAVAFGYITTFRSHSSSEGCLTAARLGFNGNVTTVGYTMFFGSIKVFKIGNFYNREVGLY